MNILNLIFVQLLIESFFCQKLHFKLTFFPSRWISWNALLNFY